MLPEVEGSWQGRKGKAARCTCCLAGQAAAGSCRAPSPPDSHPAAPRGGFQEHAVSYWDLAPRPRLAGRQRCLTCSHTPRAVSLGPKGGAEGVREPARPSRSTAGRVALCGSQVQRDLLAGLKWKHSVCERAKRHEFMLETRSRLLDRLLRLITSITQHRRGDRSEHLNCHPTPRRHPTATTPFAPRGAVPHLYPHPTPGSSWCCAALCRCLHHPWQDASPHPNEHYATFVELN